MITFFFLNILWQYLNFHLLKACHDKNYQLQIGKEVLSIDSNYYRPTEVDYLVGDPTKAKVKLGWKPEHSITSLVKEMIQSDLKSFKNN